MRYEMLTAIDHLKVELFIAVYFNKMLHCYDEAQLQYWQTLYMTQQQQRYAFYPC